MGSGLALQGAASSAFAKSKKAPPKPQNVVSPDGALKRLMAGNARYTICEILADYHGISD